MPVAAEVTPTAGINVERIGVTGGSRYGQAALVAGAYDARVALTLPKGSGIGGAGYWMVATDRGFAFDEARWSDWDTPGMH